MEEDQKVSNPTFEKPQSLRESGVTFPKARRKKVSKKFVLGVFVILLIMAAVIIFFVFRGGGEGATEDRSSPTPTIRSQPTSTPTPEPIDKTLLKLNVLNGTGISGEDSQHPGGRRCLCCRVHLRYYPRVECLQSGTTGQCLRFNRGHSPRLLCIHADY